MVGSLRERGSPWACLERSGILTRARLESVLAKRSGGQGCRRSERRADDQEFVPPGVQVRAVMASHRESAARRSRSWTIGHPGHDPGRHGRRGDGRDDQEPAIAPARPVAVAPSPGTGGSSRAGPRGRSRGGPSPTDRTGPPPPAPPGPTREGRAAIPRAIPSGRVFMRAREPGREGAPRSGGRIALRDQLREGRQIGTDRGMRLDRDDARRVFSSILSPGGRPSTIFRGRSRIRRAGPWIVGGAGEARVADPRDENFDSRTRAGGKGATRSRSECFANAARPLDCRDNRRSIIRRLGEIGCAPVGLRSRVEGVNRSRGVSSAGGRAWST